MARAPRGKPADDAAAAVPAEGEAASDGWTALREWEVRHAFVERASAQPYCVVGHQTIAGQPWEGPDAERRAAGRRARERFIERFERRQRETHAWIKLAWVADWLARKRRSTKLSEKRRARAYAQLEAAVMEGKFDRDGRSCVLFLRPDWPRVRMTREELARVRRLRPDLATFKQFFPDAAEPPDDAAVFQDLAHCWVPRDLMRRWLEEQNKPLPVHLFPPAQVSDPVGQRRGSTPVPPPITRRPVVMTALRSWYVKRHTEWPLDKSSPSADQDLRDARDAFPDHVVSRPAIRAMRGEEAPEKWTAHGRHKKLAQE